MAGGVRAMELEAGNKAGLCCIAVLFPMIPVYIVRGHSGEFYLNIGLWLMGLLPAVIHAWWIISAAPSPKSEARLGHIERKYDIAASGPSPVPGVPYQARAPSRDGTEVRPFISHHNSDGATGGQVQRGQQEVHPQQQHEEEEAGGTMLPPYESAAGSSPSSTQRIVAGGRSVRSADKGY